MVVHRDTVRLAKAGTDRSQVLSASNITDVNRGAGETGSASTQVLASAQSLSSEIAKLAAYAQGGVIRREDVDAIAVLEKDVPPWDLTDAIGARDGSPLP